MELGAQEDRDVTVPGPAFTGGDREGRGESLLQKHVKTTAQE